MNGQVLLKSQKNSLFTGIQGVELSPSDFDFIESSDAEVAELRHSSTDYYFNISLSPKGDYCVVFSPGRNTLKERRPDLNWNAVEVHFKAWLDQLVCEIEAPDLWSTVSGDAQLIKLAADQDNKLFTPEEQLQVKKALNEIKAYLIASQQLSEAQTKMIDARFNYMEEAANRLGRRDYIGIVVTTLLTVAYDQGFSGDVARDVIKFAGQIFKQFLGTMLYLAGPH